MSLRVHQLHHRAGHVPVDGLGVGDADRGGRVLGDGAVVLLLRLVVFGHRDDAEVRLHVPESRDAVDLLHVKQGVVPGKEVVGAVTLCGYGKVDVVVVWGGCSASPS